MISPVQPMQGGLSEISKKSSPPLTTLIWSRRTDGLIERITSYSRPRVDALMGKSILSLYSHYVRLESSLTFCKISSEESVQFVPAPSKNPSRFVRLLHSLAPVQSSKHNRVWIWGDVHH
ncbi:hypothetical protein AVEN_66454-1 [Araneus ventricosus]|uniref:Uncharacterized protein n=1 Tax=Araneus ventricosus TaxID=182803 RepID=A0A4Y2S426_ARAVE|nr:hypothetical protein AVEN_66454-1 [Araneus ventricosus]